MQEDKKNPGELGYGGSTTGRTFGEKGYPSGGANACLASPCTGRGRSGRPVFVRAAAPQVIPLPRSSLFLKQNQHVNLHPCCALRCSLNILKHVHAVVRAAILLKLHPGRPIKGIEVLMMGSYGSNHLMQNQTATCCPPLLQKERVHKLRAGST